jgi:nitroalkane oxidase
MAIDFTLTAAQAALQQATRGRARAILSGVAGQVRYLPTPEERFAATRPAYERLVKEGLLRQLIPAPAGGEGHGMTEMAIVAEELYAVDASVSLTAFASLLGLRVVDGDGSYSAAIGRDNEWSLMTEFAPRVNESNSDPRIACALLLEPSR